VESERRRFWLLVILALLSTLIVWLLWLFGTSEPFGSCIHQRKNYQAYQALHKETLFPIKLNIRLALNAACGVHVSNEYQGAIVALSGIAVAIFTGTLWWSTTRLWRSTDRLVHGAEDTATRQLRAYVFVAEAEIVGLGTLVPMVNITIRNTGQTPAYDVIMSAMAKAFNSEQVAVFDEAKPDENSSRFVFGPSAHGRRTVELAAFLGQPEQRTALQSRNGPILFVWGVITYRDEFSADRETEFRLEIGGRHGWPADNRMSVSPHGNRAE
jgi:hypothetical protein